MIENVSRETHELLEAYCALVRKWNPRVNLISKNSLPDLWKRHIQDSLQLIAIETNRTQWVDLGSGGGFPGLVVACVLKEENPAATVTLVESDQRKAVFLRTAARQLGLNVHVHSDRIEAIDSLGATTLSARALAPLNKLLGYAQKHLSSEGQALLPKGASWEKELEEACQEWSFDCRSVRSQTEESASILVVRDIKKR